MVLAKQLHCHASPMKILGLSIVVVLGLGVVLWRVGEPPRAAQEAPVEHSARRAAIGPSNVTTPTVMGHPRPELATQERPTLEPTDADPKRREAQEQLWQYLRVFATEAELTDTQWDRFVRDLSELAAIESAAWDDSIRAGKFGDISRLNDELGYELEERISAYMTDQQLRVFRFRIIADGVVTQVRALHFVPSSIPES